MVSSEVDHRCGNRGIGNGDLFRAGYPCAREQSQHRGNKPAISHFVLPCSGVFRSARNINEPIAGFSNCVQNGCDLRHPPKAPLVEVPIEILDCLPDMHGTEPSYRRDAQGNIARHRRQGQAPTLKSSFPNPSNKPKPLARFAARKRNPKGNAVRQSRNGMVEGLLTGPFLPCNSLFIRLYFQLWLRPWRGSWGGE